MRVLLVNPPIFDFTAFDFWLRPYGLLRVAGALEAEREAFDFLVSRNRDEWGRGRFDEQIVPKPAALADIPRHFRRFGRPREEFRELLRRREFDEVLIQTVMTYWYLGVLEVIEDVRAIQPRAKITLGGVYATLCPDHARSLGPDAVVEGLTTSGRPPWELVDHEVGVLKITEGCPFQCTYCSVPQIYPAFKARPLEYCLEELRALVQCGARHVAFYDDALLHRPEKILMPFLDRVLLEDLRVSFHTPNALNARFITPDLARLMVRAGFKTFFLGFESAAYEWQKKTGGKVYSEEFADAVRHLREAGAESITAYLIVAHPSSDDQAVEASIEFATQAGARVMLSEFAPIPGTPDGELCRTWVDLSEPLNHNKTAFAIRRLGRDRLESLKQICRQRNSDLNSHFSSRARPTGL